MTVWLTATQHCALGAVGAWDLFASAPDSCCCDPVQHDCNEDACDVVEGGSVKVANASIQVPAPTLTADLAAFLAMAREPAATVEPIARYADGIDRPLGWVPTWHFERRAAQPSRAPSWQLA